jgi:predicted phosphodiesterase
MTIQQQAVASVLDRFPNHPTKTLARKAYAENKALWPNLEAAYTAFRRARGAVGHWHRKADANKSRFRPLQKPGDAFGKIPEGKTDFESWGARQFNGPLNALVLSDIHVPYHDRQALVLALQHGRKAGANLVLLNGDILDCFSISRWEKDPRERDCPGELAACRAVLQSIREGFPRARIIYKLGNHEERFQSYMFCKAPELLGVEEFELKNLLRFEELKIECVGDKRPIRLGDLNVIHGHEYRFAISNPVNPARGLFLRGKAYGMCGHFHQTSHHTEKTVEQKNIATWSTGCLCDMHPEYAPINNWSHGFAMVQVGADGRFEVQNHYIAKGKIY